MPLTSHYLMQEDHNDHRWWLARSHQEWVEEFDFPWVAAADAIYRLGGRSPGADAEVELATRLGIPVLLSLLDVQEFCAKWKPKEQHASSMERLWDKVKDINGGRKLPELEPLPYPAEEAAGSAEAERDARIMAAEMGDHVDHQKNAEHRQKAAGAARRNMENIMGPEQPDKPAIRVTYETTEEMKKETVSAFVDAVAATSHHNSLLFMQILADCAKLHIQKSLGYGSERDSLENVRASEAFGVPSFIGVAIRLNDKMQRLKNLASRGSLSCEPAEDAFYDICCYGAIGLVLLREWQEKEARNEVH